MLTKNTANVLSLENNELTHWGRGKMSAIFQTPFSNAFSWIKIVVFWWKFRWNLFPRVQLTIFQLWFREWLGASQETSHYLNQWWLSLMTHTGITWAEWVKNYSSFPKPIFTAISHLIVSYNLPESSAKYWYALEMAYLLEHIITAISFSIVLGVIWKGGTLVLHLIQYSLLHNTLLLWLSSSSSSSSLMDTWTWDLKQMFQMYSKIINSLVPTRCGNDIKNIVFKSII